MRPVCWPSRDINLQAPLFQMEPTVTEQTHPAKLAEVVRLALLRRREVEARTGLSRSTLYGLIKRRKFPPPIKLTDSGDASRTPSGWLESEVSDWIADRVRVTRGGA